MIRIKDITDALLHLVGWEQSYDPKYRVSESLTKSESGITFQQMHPLMTLQNMRAIAPMFEEVNDVYDPDKQYGIGQLVSFQGSKYRALQDSKGKEPSTSPEYWVMADPFSVWLESKMRASIVKVVTRLGNEKLSEGTMKSLCETKTLFNGTGRIHDTVKNKHNLVGFEITPVRAPGVTTKISRIGLQFTKAGTYHLFLMQSGRDTPYKEIVLTKTEPNTMEWFSIDDCFLPYQGTGIDTGGSWYLCYYQDDLPEGSEAIKKDFDWSKGPCSSCSKSQYINWQAWSRYLEVHPFYVGAELLSGGYFNDDYNEDFNHVELKLWDIDKNTYIYDTNFGLNLEVSVNCDVTDIFIEQRLALANLIALQAAVDAIREFAYNPNTRINKNSMNVSRMEALYELDGDSSSNKKSGLAYNLEKAYAAAKLSFTGISKVCLPCNNHGIKYRTV